MRNDSRYQRPDAIAMERRTESPRRRCWFSDCGEEVFSGLPVCFICAIQIGQFMRDLFANTQRLPEYGCDLPPGHYAALERFVEDSLAVEAENANYTPDPGPAPVVYYLMLSPVTVKIGTTSNLRKRLAQLRTELQYVIAVEPGYRSLERERHLQFADDRRDRREDFYLSPALKRHIDDLAPQREEVLKLAWDAPI